MTRTITATDLIGSWHLSIWQVVTTIDGERQAAVYPFGRRPSGLLIYSADGWMSATVSRADRSIFPAGQSPRKLDDVTVAEAYLSYFHYAGRWRLEGDQVIHSVILSHNPNMTGTEQVRRMTLKPGRLSLAGEESFGDRQRLHQLDWRREMTDND